MGCVIDQRPCSYAILIGHDIGLRFGILEVKRVDIVFVLDYILFAVRHVQFVGGRLQVRRMGFHLKADLIGIAFLQTGEECCRIVAYVLRLENDLELRAGLHRVSPEKIIADISPAASLYTEILIAVIVDLVPTVLPVKIVADSHFDFRMVLVMPQPVGCSIGSPNRIEVKLKVGRNRADIISKLVHVHADLHRSSSAGDGKDMHSHVICLVCPCIERLCERQLVDCHTVHSESDSRGRG